jgi:hypothetical protein
MEHRVVGIHMAGSSSKSVFNPIEPVLSLLDIEIPDPEGSLTSCR